MNFIYYSQNYKDKKSHTVQTNSFTWKEDQR